MAQKLSHQLRAAEDRIAELEAEVLHQERAERADWTPVVISIGSMDFPRGKSNALPDCEMLISYT